MTMLKHRQARKCCDDTSGEQEAWNSPEISVFAMRVKK